VNLLILDEPTNHLDMASKDVLKAAIRAFDGTAIIVSHDRDFLDGLVTRVYEFGGGRVREHLGGIYDWLRAKEQAEQRQTFVQKENAERTHQSSQHPQNTESLGVNAQNSQGGRNAYAEHKEQQKRKARAEKAVKASERKIEEMEKRLKELDALFAVPENASDMTLVTEYTDTKRQLDEEMARWEQLMEETEQ
jgi:ATP-binding cassette subfamily F protein 3